MSFNKVFFTFMLTILSLFNSASYAQDHQSYNSCCNPCGKLCRSDFPVCEEFVTVPARFDSEQDKIIPSVNIYIKRQGPRNNGKDPLLFVHGLGGSTSVWACQIEELSRHFDVIAIDLRGHGESGKTAPLTSTNPDGIKYTHEVFSTDVHYVLNQLNIDRMVLIQHCGSIGIYYTWKYPSEVSKLVLSGADPIWVQPNDNWGLSGCDPVYPNECWPWVSLTQEQVAGIKQSTVDFGFEWVVATMMIPTFYNDPCQCLLSNAKNAYVQSMLTTGQDIIFSMFDYLDTQDLRGLLPEISAETLLTFGTIDEVVPLGAQYYMRDFLQNVQMAPFEGLGHFHHVTNYKKYNRVIKEFVSGKRVCVDYDNGKCCVCPLVKPGSFVGIPKD